MIAGCAGREDPAAPRGLARLEAIEKQLGGRLGLTAIDTSTGVRLGHRAAERFAMASTFKVLLAGFVLSKVDRGELKLDEALPFAQADVLDYAPVAQAKLASGALTVEEASAAIVEVSDNTAANLLLAKTGGPPALTAWLRSIGDSVTRLDRNEPSLNTNTPGDPRDTTTPDSMAETVRTLVHGARVLTETSRERLAKWLEGSTTGKQRLRAGLPPHWKAGDKTGTGENGASNDVAVVWTTGRAPIVIASYIHAPSATDHDRNAAHAEVARFVIGTMG